MAALVVPEHRRPPAIYRLARALRWLSALVLVALIIFAGTVAYSAFEVARSSTQSHGLSASLAANGTVEIVGSFTLANPGFYPIQGFELTARIANATDVLLGQLGVGPSDIAPSSTGTFPIALYLPVDSSAAATSLLTQDQYLRVDAWGNATYAYLFPLSVALTENRSWGAPFEDFQVTVGTPSGGGGSIIVPVTVTFSNHAPFAESGVLTFTVQSSGGADCGGGSFPISVPSQGLYDQTQDVALASGCSPLGGQLLSTYSTGGTPVPLPPESIS
ncbi:MAG: hypothetical protein ACLP8Y_08275 [Thermoplasmata archaeon]